MPCYFCLGCWEVQAFASGPPAKCGKCGGEWRRAATLTLPIRTALTQKTERVVHQKVYKLSEQDRRFLHQLNILPEI